MVIHGWTREKKSRPSLTSIPEAVIRNKVICMLGEGAAFRARGISKLFATAYFDQAYKRPNGIRVFNMLVLGHEYPRLESLAPKYYNLTDLSSLIRMPSLTELNLSRVNDLNLMTFPDSLCHLKKLDLSNCSIVNISPLDRLPALMELDLPGN